MSVFRWRLPARVLKSNHHPRDTIEKEREEKNAIGARRSERGSFIITPQNILISQRRRSWSRRRDDPPLRRALRK